MPDPFTINGMWIISRHCDYLSFYDYVTIAWRLKPNGQGSRKTKYVSFS